LTGALAGVATALGAGLPGVAVRTLALDDAAMTTARDQRAVSLLASELAAGNLRLGPGDDDAALVAGHEAAMVQCLLLERALLGVVGDLADAGVELRILKGPAVAHLDYPDPAWRTFGDLDLLVRSRDYDTAVAVLERRGARRRSAEVRPGFDRRFAKGVCMIGADGMQVDLHRLLTTGPFGVTGHVEECFDDSEPVLLGGEAVPALTRELRFLHACQHAVLGDWPARLVPLRDVAQLRLARPLDFDAVLRRAAAWRCTLVVARAVMLATVTLDLPADPVVEWATSYEGTAFERRALAACMGPDRSYARQMVATLPAVPGVAAKLAFVRALLVPHRDYVARHDGGYGRRLRRALRAGRNAS
jgi:hypothetical protein